MTEERVVPLDAQSLELFARKGTQGGASTPQMANANGAKVRRIMQLVRDLAGKPFADLRILDLACGEGVYAIEAALRGATVVASDARTQRMDEGAAVAARAGLGNVSFTQEDVRQVDRATHGGFDVVLFLGILYHLDERDAFPVVERLHALTDRMLVIDTHVALHPKASVDHAGSSYHGVHFREHDPQDADAVKGGRLLASIDNPTSFWFTRESLVRLLRKAGFTSVLECHAPPEPSKTADRITLVALKGDPVKVSTYPWINDRADDEVERFIAQDAPAAGAPRVTLARRTLNAIQRVVNVLLRPLGFRVNRL